MPRNITLLLLLSLALAAACAQQPQPVTAAKPAATAPAPSPEKAPAPAPAEAAPAKPEPSRDAKVVVVDPGDDAANHPKTLVEAAREERERRAHAGEPVAVITNKTLPHAKGQLTYAQPGTKPAGDKATPATPATPAVTAEGDKGKEKEKTKGETYWRQRGLEIRQRWRRAADEVGKLEQSVADWRRRFYSEDDPAVRDAQVKPEWDRALDRLRHQKEEVLATQRELEAFLEEGRRAGALPGWLREGNDLEPAPPPPPPSPTEAIEPPQLPDGPP